MCKASSSRIFCLEHLIVRKAREERVDLVFFLENDMRMMKREIRRGWLCSRAHDDMSHRARCEAFCEIDKKKRLWWHRATRSSDKRLAS